ncbi:putative gustatory receptor 28b [Bradysia coprophila]|uniref:putative gustatory receptor 28b n=1 Tax=Bradysia coprophila TaxID=38358 RepID=UPI00187DA7A4|nr:putative gustatory receptor 28b [Bradysia coprophila]
MWDYDSVITKTVITPIVCCTFNSTEMVKGGTSLKRALWPLFIVSKLFGICPFSIRHERVSYLGTIVSIVMLASYCSFHFISASDELTDNSSETNFVTMAINSFNRYSGIVSLFVIAVMGIVHQKEILNALQIMHSIDGIFRKEVNIEIDDSIYSRNIKIGLVSIIAAISVLEYFNCLMFIQSYAPFNEYCLTICLVPFVVTCITEIQFIAYMQLLKNRLELINNFFGQFRGDAGKSAKTNIRKSPDPSPLTTKIFTVNKVGDKLKILSSQKNGFNGLGTNVIIMENCGKTVGKQWTDNLQLNRKLFTEKIMKLQIIYNKMEKFLVQIRSGYSIQIITVFTVKFSIITSMLYACCMILIKSVSTQILTDDDREQLISSSMWISLMLLEMFSLCYVCHSMETEARQIGCNIHHFGREIIYHECKLQVKAFSFELLHNRIEFRPLGLYKLNLEFLYNLFGAISAYLIILIQFDMAQHIVTATSQKL